MRHDNRKLFKLIRYMSLPIVFSLGLITITGLVENPTDYSYDDVLNNFDRYM